MKEPKRMILVVDDDVDVRLLCKAVLEAKGYETVIAENGYEGLRAYKKYPNLALVLTDVIMPELNGTDMVRAIFAANPHANVIMMTGFSPDIISEDLRNVCAVVVKPFTFEYLLATVQECLDDHAARHEV